MLCLRSEEVSPEVKVRELDCVPKPGKVSRLGHERASAVLHDWGF